MAKIASVHGENIESELKLIHSPNCSILKCMIHVTLQNYVVASNVHTKLTLFY